MKKVALAQILVVISVNGDGEGAVHCPEKNLDLSSNHSPIILCPISHRCPQNN